MKKKKKKHVDKIELSEKGTKKELRRKKPRRKWWKKLMSFFITCCALGVFAVFGFLIYIVQSCGEFDPNKLANQDQTIIYDSKNNVIAKLGIEKRESISYDKLPQVLIDAIVATEDSRFFQHNGVDGARFFKASVGQVLGHSDAGGASTLTMQVVKNNFTSTKKSIIRKFQDIYLAVFFMERKYTKEEIMDFYVNDSFLGGSSVYGVEEAAKYYFGKSVSDISLPEAAIIAGMFQAPYSYDPYRFPDKTKKRMNTVLKLMVRHGYITQEEADDTSKIDIGSILVGKSESENKYQGFIDTVVEEVKKKTGNDPAIASMQIYTTMDPAIQDGINNILAGKDSYTWVNDKVQAGITIIDVKTGAIAAVGTGRNRTGERSLNYATQTYRQPGSTAKPIFAYGPGFEFDNFSTYQLFNDEPWSYSSGGSPGNWDGGYHGLITLRTALAVSRNIPAIKALQYVNADVGNKKIVNFVEGLGIKLRDGVAYESYAIGGLEKGVTTAQMAAAYAAFANGGYYTAPYTVKSITYRGTGETTEFETKRTQAMKDSTAYLMNNVLSYAARHGFSGGTSAYRGTVAAKTGTSNYDEATMRKHGLPSYAVNDLWTVAYTPQHSIALWYGYDKIDSQYFNGSGTPKDQLMAAIMKYIPVTNDEFPACNSVVAAQVEMGSWPPAKPSANTPGDMILTEYFISGTEPTEESPRFQKINAVTSLKAANTSNGVKLTWDYKPTEIATKEFWTKYYSDRTFGNGTQSFVNSRNDLMGDLGYYVYLKEANGNLKQLAFVTDKSYVYKSLIDANLTFVVKAGYSKFSGNASDGVNVSIQADGHGVPDDDSPSPSQKLLVSLVGAKNIELAADEAYTESGVKVSYAGKDVTTDERTTITYLVNNEKCSTISEVETKVNSLVASGKDITILYNVSFDPDDDTTNPLHQTSKRTITIK